jgi:hypothetical protein
MSVSGMMPSMALGADVLKRPWRRPGAMALLALAWTAGGAGAAGAAGAAGGAWATTVPGHAAAGAPPTLLATAPGEDTGFSVRPGLMTFDPNRPRRTPDFLEGPDLTAQGFEAGRQPPIVWTHWGARAVGHASYWIGYHTPCRGCRYALRAVRIAASRVVGGRYTRLSITDVDRGRASTYDLASVRVPSDGVSGGVPAFAWCNARDPNVCSPP